MKKTNFKLYASILLTLIIATVCIFGLSGCKSDVEQIYVSNSHTPRLNYVQGQDLDISGGIITAVVKGEETLIPMNAEGVTITGYDKNVLGPQTITVTYEEQTTTFQVNVIERIKATGFEKGYFIGDSIKMDKGNLVIAKDDATTFKVNLNDQRVTLKSFDSSAAGTKEVTVEYNDGTVSYTCTFNVEVYGASKVSIVYPNKKSYLSHETELNFDGGYLTIKAGENDSLTKHVDITADMTSGFDISQVTIANRTTPLTQTITISYLGHTFTYNISIKYSSLSIVNDMLPAIKNVDLTGEKIVLTDAEKAAAYDAVKEFLNLSTREKELLSEDDADRIVRCGAVATNELYLNGFSEYKILALVQQPNGQIGIQILADTVDAAKAGVAAMTDENATVNEYAEVLRTLQSEYADTVIADNKTIAQSILVLSKDVQTNIKSAIEHVIELHEILSVVPNDWTVETLADYKDAILAIEAELAKETFYQNGNTVIYNALEKWREKNDFFEIFYSYYLYATEKEPAEAEAYIIETLFKIAPLPSTVTSWYSLYYQSMYIAQNLYKYNTQLYLYDITPFMYYYEKFLDKTDEILDNDDDKLSQDMLDLMDYDLLIRNVHSYYCGYYYNSGTLTESENYRNLWESYLELYELYQKGELVEADGKFVVGSYAEKFDAVMANLAKLTPRELYGFISSLNFLYNNSHDNSILVLSKYNDTKYLNTLSLLLHAYYGTTLDKASVPAFENLMKAMENFALNGKKATAIDDFKAAMKAIIDMSASDRASFEAKLGDVYNKYLIIYNALGKTYNITADDAELFTVLADTINQIYEINDIINQYAGNNSENSDMPNGIYVLVFALYEKAEAYYNEIIKRGQDNVDILNNLYLTTYTVDGKEVTLERSFIDAGSVYWYYVTNITLKLTTSDGREVSYCVFDIQQGTKFASFIGYAADFLYAQFKGDFSEFTGTESVNYVFEIINKFHSLDNMGAGLFRALGGTALYFDGIDVFITAQLEGDSASIALMKKLIDASEAYFNYAVYDNEDSLEEFKTLMAEVETLKAAITNTENYDTYIKALYEFYKTGYDEIMNPPTEGGENTEGGNVSEGE